MQPKEIQSEQNKIKLRQIYEKYKNRMYISACRVLQDPTLAEDAVHDTFITLSRNIEKIQDVDSICTASYVTIAAKNRALNMVKKNAKESILPIEEIDEIFDESMLDMICSKETFNIIVNSIMELDEKYRDVLSLYYLNELTVREIADVLARKETTIKQQLVRGRRKLINLITKEIDGYGKKESVNKKSV